MPFSPIEFALRGPAGEPIDLWRTIVSHGVASLPPLSVDEEKRVLTATLALPKSKPRTVLVRAAARRGFGVIHVEGSPPAPRLQVAIVDALRHILSMDRDLSGFYAMIASDPALAWAAAGAGRMVRSQSVFEEVVKTVCTTNCAWSATERMVGAIVGTLGEPAAGGSGRAFPTPEVMASTPESFYRDVARAGYRGAYLRSLAESVASGDVDLEAMAAAPVDDEVFFKELLALPGVGPYAAAHIMLMIGRHSRPILDSWTRPKYARLTGKKSVPDKTILRRFARYGEHAGLACWLFVTRDWVDD